MFQWGHRCLSSWFWTFSLASLCVQILSSFSSHLARGTYFYFLESISPFRGPLISLFFWLLDLWHFYLQTYPQALMELEPTTKRATEQRSLQSTPARLQWKEFANQTVGTTSFGACTPSWICLWYHWNDINYLTHVQSPLISHSKPNWPLVAFNYIMRSIHHIASRGTKGYRTIRNHISAQTRMWPYGGSVHYARYRSFISDLS